MESSDVKCDRQGVLFQANRLTIDIAVTDNPERVRWVQALGREDMPERATQGRDYDSRS